MATIGYCPICNVQHRKQHHPECHKYFSRKAFLEKTQSDRVRYEKDPTPPLGWICPVCGASLAPTVPRCGCTAPLGAEYVEDVSIFDTLTICDSCGGLSIHHAPPTCKKPDNHFKAPQGEVAPFGKRDSLL